MTDPVVLEISRRQVEQQDLASVLGSPLMAHELDETHTRESIMSSFLHKKASEGKVRDGVNGLSHGHEAQGIKLLQTSSRAWPPQASCPWF